MGKNFAKCGALNCHKIFEIKGSGNPEIYICPECECKINRGIMITLHERTGRIKGNFNILDKIYNK